MISGATVDDVAGGSGRGTAGHVPTVTTGKSDRVTPSGCASFSERHHSMREVSVKRPAKSRPSTCPITSRPAKGAYLSFLLGCKVHLRMLCKERVASRQSMKSAAPGTSG